MDTAQQGIIRARIDAAARNGGHLYLIGIGLREFPAEVLALENLRSLDLRDNFLDALPLALAKYADLKQLNLANNRFVEIPPVIREFGALEKLDISSNQIQSIDLKNELPTGLQKLDCAHNRIKTLHQLGAPASLATINGKDNLIDALHVACIRASKLQDLDLESNALATLPDAFARLNRLELVCLSRNKLTRVPDLLARLPRLGLLQLNYNEITGFDWNPDQLPIKLEVLEIRHNQVSALPAWLPLLKKLSLLALDGNPLQECSGSCLPASLRRLLMNACGLMRLIEIEVCKDLEVLQANSNLLSGHSHLALPASLRLLDLSNNQLEALTIQLPTSTRLETLLLAHNSLAALEIDAQPLKLQRLDLSSNRLTSLSDFYVNSQYLIQVYLADNLLEEIPPVLASMTRLHTLILSQNRIRAVPDWIAKMPWPACLWLNDNPLEGVSPDVLNGGWVALILHGTPFAASTRPSRIQPWLTKELLSRAALTGLLPKQNWNNRLWVETRPDKITPYQWGLALRTASEKLSINIAYLSDFKVGQTGIFILRSTGEKVAFLPVGPLNEEERMELVRLLSSYYQMCYLSQLMDLPDTDEGPGGLGYLDNIHLLHSEEYKQAYSVVEFLGMRD